MGVFVAGINNPGSVVSATKLDKNAIGWMRANAVGKAIQLQSPTNVRTYVFFTLNGHDRRAWQRGQLQIKFKPSNSATWQTCTAIAVNSAGSLSANTSSSNKSSSNNNPARLACLATQNGTYVLVRTASNNKNTSNTGR